MRPFAPVQRYWAWNGLDTSFRDQTALMKDIHHYAWRAKGLNETVYLDPNDLRKFNNWTVQVGAGWQPGRTRGRWSGSVLRPMPGRDLAATTRQHLPPRVLTPRSASGAPPC